MLTVSVHRNIKSMARWLVLVFAFSWLLPSAAHPQTAVVTSKGDVDGIAVMEFAGSYDAALITNEFYRTHNDEYDFIILLNNFSLSGTTASYTGIQNGIQGIGLDIPNSTAYYGSAGRLQGLIEMGNIANLVSDPVNPAFEETLTLLTHQMMHRWAADIKFLDGAGGESSALLSNDGNHHWSFLLDTNGSALYGNHWQDNGDTPRTFTSIEPERHSISGLGRTLSPLDLYLMGMIPADQVPSMLLIENATDMNGNPIMASRSPEVGVTINGAGRSVSINDIIAAMGLRVPSAADSPKAFKTAFIYLAGPGTFPDMGFLGVQNIRNEWVKRFTTVTDGKAAVSGSTVIPEDLPINPGADPTTGESRTAPYAVREGVAWLAGRQQQAGYWEDSAITRERDTAESVLTLKGFSDQQVSSGNGALWLASGSNPNNDYLCRSIEALLNTGQNVAVLVDELVLRRNADGGWGSEKEYQSNPLDTALALKALSSAGYQGPTVLSGAISFLTGSRNADHGWGAGEGSQVSAVQPTSAVLSAMKPYRTSHQLETVMSEGAAWLASRKNGDGGFGNSPSTVYDTAAAVRALADADPFNVAVGTGLAWLRAAQSRSGSWNESVYQTALATRALWDLQTDPDLSIAEADISFNPPFLSGAPPVDVTVSALVWNYSNVDAPVVTVALYDGDPSLGNMVAQNSYSIPKQAAALATFRITVTDSIEHAYFVSIVLANDPETRNNTASKTLEVLQPSMAGFGETASSGAESTAAVTIPVVLDHSWPETVTVKYAVNTGTSTADPSDYAFANGTLTFEPGETSKNLTLTINDDLAPEQTETVVITLYAPVNALLGMGRFIYTILDNDPVLVDLLLPSAGVTADNTPYLSYAQNGGTVTVYLDNEEPMEPQPQNNLDMPALSDGTHTIRVEATDTAGHFTSDEVSITVDTTAPMVSILSPMAGTIPDNTPVLAYQVNDAQASVIVKMDGFTVNKTSGGRLDFLQDGSHIVRVEATDAVGNAGYAEAAFVVNGPAITEEPYAIGPKTAVHDLPANYNNFEDHVSVSVDEEGLIRVVSKQYANTYRYDPVANSLILQTPKNLVTDGVSSNGHAAIDSCGNTYVIGKAGSVYDMAMTKISNTGTVVWSQTWGTCRTGEEALAVETDVLGNAWVTGNVDDRFGTGCVGTDKHTFLTRFDAKKTTGDSIYSYMDSYQYAGSGGNDITGGTAGYVYVADADGTVKKIDRNSILQWSIASQGGSSIIQDLYGNIYAIDGSYSGGTLTKMTPEGTIIWTRKVIDNTTSTNWGVKGSVSDKQGNVYLVGYTEITLNGIATAGGADAFVIKFDGRGNRLWTKLIGSSTYDYGHGIAVDDNDDLYITVSGDLEGTGTKAYLVKLLKNGTAALSQTTTYYLEDPLPNCSQTIHDMHTDNQIQILPLPLTLVTTKGTCAVEDILKVKNNSTNMISMLLAQRPGDGYAADTLVKGSAAGASLSFMTENSSGGAMVELVEMTTSGTVIRSLSSISINLIGNILEYIGSLSGLSGTVTAGNTFGIRISMKTTDTGNGIYSVIKWGQANNCEPGTRQWITVTETPADDIVAPASTINATLDSGYNVTGTANDGTGVGVSKVEVSVDGGAWNAATDTSGNGSWSAWSYPLVVGADGAYPIQSRATDKAGNMETPAAGVTVVIIPSGAAPTGLTATAIYTNRINLSWTDRAASELGYKIERSENGGIFAEIATVTSGTIAFTDNGLTGGVQYSYRVRASYDSGGFSDYSNTASAVPTASPQPAISVSTELVDFKTALPTGSVLSSVLTIQNAGLADLQIGSIAVSENPNEFSITGNTCSATVAPGGSCSVTIAFTVHSIGPRSATLAISSNDPVSPLYSVALTGFGEWPSDTITMFAAGGYQSVAVKADGTLWAWGGGYLGEDLGLWNLIPRRRGPDSNWMTLSAGYSHTLGLKTDGSLWAWGLNSSGQLGDSTTTNKETPIQIARDGLPDGKPSVWLAVSAGSLYSTALRNDGTIWSWGDNRHGQLGNNSTVNSNAPVQVIDPDPLHPWTAVSAGASYALEENNYTLEENHTVALKADGSLWAWGYNAQGQLGNNSTVNSNAPVQVIDPDPYHPWTAVSAGGRHTAALKSDGSLWVWGANNKGQVGDETYSDRRSPQQINTSGATGLRWIAIATGGAHTIAIRSDGTLWAWGDNDFGQLGNGNIGIEPVPVPTQVGTDNTWVEIATTNNHNLAMKSDGTLWSWGDNGSSKVGVDCTYDVFGNCMPIPQPVLVGMSGSIVINANAFYTTILGATLSLTASEAFDGLTIDAMTFSNDGVTWTAPEPFPASTPATKTWDLLGGDGKKTVLVRYRNSPLGLWSQAFSDTIILDTTPPACSAGVVKINGRSPFTNSTEVTVALSATDANGIEEMTLSSDGTTWQPAESYKISRNWTLVAGEGRNNIYVKFKDNVGHWSDICTGSIVLDVMPPTGSIVINGGAGYTSNPAVTLTLSAADTNGISEMKFSNDNTSWSVSEPYAPSKQWMLSAVDGPQTVHVKYRDAAGNWSADGYNDTIILDSAPPTGSIVINGGAGYTNSTTVTLTLSASDANGVAGMMFSTDGTAWSEPEPFGTTKNWTLSEGGDGKAVFVKFQDGSGLWSVAYGDMIVLDTTPPSETVFTQISAGNKHTVGLKADGTFWAWGNNIFGQLGDDTNADKAIPTKIGMETNWTAVAAGAVHTAALKADGSLWTWGYNYYGQLGDGSTVDRKKPYNVLPGTKWKSIAAGTHHTIALRDDNTLWAWGYNAQGQLGNSTITDSREPVPVIDPDPVHPWTVVAAGGYHTLGLKSDGSLWVWGHNNRGQSGHGDTAPDKLVPTKVPTGVWKSMAGGVVHSLGINDSDALMGWGGNTSGELGISPLTDRWTPHSINTAALWAAAAGGRYHTAAIRQDGSLWTWGGNNYGQLGDGSTTQRTEPAQIGPGRFWIAVATGHYHTVVLEQDGTLWASGQNTYKQLGDGGATDQPSLVRLDTDGAVVINDRAYLSNSIEVTLSLKPDDINSIAEMQFSNDGATWSPAEAYAPSRAAWDITDPAYGGSAGDGVKTVFVRFRDAAGNWSGAFSDTIILNTAGP